MAAMSSACSRARASPDAEPDGVMRRFPRETGWRQGDAPGSKQDQAGEAEEQQPGQHGEDPAFLSGGGEDHGWRPTRPNSSKSWRRSGSAASFSQGWLLEKRMKYCSPSRWKPYFNASSSRAGTE